MNSSGYFAEIWQKRFFWWALVRMDLRNRYRRSILGIGWSLLHPIAMTIILCLVFANLFSQPIAEFGPYVLSGMALWTYVNMLVMDGCHSFIQSEAYLRQKPVPLAIYPLRTTLSASIQFLLTLVVLLALVCLFRGPPTQLSLLTLPIVLGMLFILGWCVTSCVSLLNIMFQDTQHILQVVLQVVFYATPVFYPASLLRERNLGWILDFNPVAAYLSLIRDPLLYNRLPTQSAAYIALGTLIVVGLIATFAMARMQRRLVFYL